MALALLQFRAIAGQRGAMLRTQVLVLHRTSVMQSDGDATPVYYDAARAPTADVFPELVRTKVKAPKSAVVLMKDGIYVHRSRGVRLHQLELFSRQRILSLVSIRAWLKKRNSENPFPPDRVLQVYTMYRDYGVSAMCFSQELQLPAHITVPRTRPVNKHILDFNLRDVRVTVLDLLMNLAPHRLAAIAAQRKKFDVLAATESVVASFPDLVLSVLNDEALLVLNFIYAKPPQSTVHPTHVTELGIRYQILKLKLLARQVNIDAELLTTMPGVGGCVMAFHMSRKANADELGPPPEESHATACPKCRFHGTRPVKDGAVPEDWYKCPDLHSFYQFKMAPEDRESCELCDEKLRYSHPIYGGKLRPGGFTKQALDQLGSVDLTGNEDYFRQYADVLDAELDVPFGPMTPYFGSQGFKADEHTMVDPLLSLGFRVSPTMMDDRNIKTTATFREYFGALRKVADFEDLRTETRSTVLRNCEKLPPLTQQISTVQTNPGVHRLLYLRTRTFHSSIPDNSRRRR